MPQYIAFLRGINLGHRRLKMDELRARFEELRFRDVATFIASGNVLFTTAATDERKLVDRIQRHLEKSLGYAVDTFVRTRAEVATVVAAQPFPPSELATPTNTVHVGFLSAPLPPPVAAKLAAIRSAVDELRVIGREFYWLCRIRTPDSKIWSAPALRALKLPSSTMRNLSMLRRLAAQFPAA